MSIESAKYAEIEDVPRPSSLPRSTEGLRTLNNITSACASNSDGGGPQKPRITPSPQTPSSHEIPELGIREYTDMVRMLVELGFEDASADETESARCDEAWAAAMARASSSVVRQNVAAPDSPRVDLDQVFVVDLKQTAVRSAVPLTRTRLVAFDAYTGASVPFPSAEDLIPS